MNSILMKNISLLPFSPISVSFYLFHPSEAQMLAGPSADRHWPELLVDNSRRDSAKPSTPDTPSEVIEVTTIQLNV